MDINFSISLTTIILLNHMEFCARAINISGKRIHDYSIDFLYTKHCWYNQSKFTETNLDFYSSNFNACDIEIILLSHKFSNSIWFQFESFVLFLKEILLLNSLKLPQWWCIISNDNQLCFALTQWFQCLLVS